jgi:hypothetical protein
MTKVWEPYASLKGAKILLVSELQELEALEVKTLQSSKTLECRIYEVTWTVDPRIPRDPSQPSI